MNENRLCGPRATGAALLVTTALLLAGCSAGQSQPGATDEDAGADAGADAARFVACLTSHGVDARIGGDNGLVFVVTPSAGTTGNGGSGASGGQALAFETSDDGRFWVAAKDSTYFSQAPDTGQSYASCEAEVPGFRQPDVGSGELQLQAGSSDEQQQYDLDFARCAREAGFTWVADPSPETGGGIVLPLDLKETEFRALLTACFEKDSPWISWRFNGQLSFDYVAVLNDFTGNTMGEVTNLGPVDGGQ